MTARLGRALGICFGICFATGMLSHYQYQPWSWLPEPANPVWAYRFTQGLHVATGVASIPLLLVKLWSVYPNLFRRPPVRSLVHAIERLSVFVLVSSAIVQLTTGFLNTLDWYPWPWSFPSTHRYLAYVLIGSSSCTSASSCPTSSTGCRPGSPRPMSSPRSRGARTRSPTATPGRWHRRRCRRWTAAASSSPSERGSAPSC